MFTIGEISRLVDLSFIDGLTKARPKTQRVPWPVMVARVLPAGSCEAGRSVAVLRRVKTHLRATTSEERLGRYRNFKFLGRTNSDGCGLVRTKHLNTEGLGRCFIQLAHPRRLFCNSLIFTELTTLRKRNYITTLS